MISDPVISDPVTSDPMTLACRLAQPDDVPAIRDWVRANPASDPFHDPAWLEIAGQISGQSPSYLIAEANGAIAGVLPIGYRKSLLFGKTAMSAPFAVKAAPLADTSDIAALLVTAAWQEAQQRGYPSLALRMLETDWQHLAPYLPDADMWSLARHSAYFVQDLPDSRDDYLLTIRKRSRANVRKALGSGLVIRYGGDHFSDFYDIYADSVQRLGSPVFPRQLSEALEQYFADDAEIAVVTTEDGEPISALMTLFWKGRALPYYTGCRASARVHHANNLLYYDMFCRAIDRGCTVGEFGKSRLDTGPYQFKKNWGATPLAMVEAIRCHTPGYTQRVDQSNYGLQQRVWRRLPRFAARALGPHLARHLG